MKRSFKKSGFTLVELMVALLIASIILAAVSTLAGAVTAADKATDQMGREQSQLRLVSMRLTDLIRRANHITTASADGFQLWHDKNGDGFMTANELTQVYRGVDGNTLTIGSQETYSNCKNISFGYDDPLGNPRFITIRFDMTENGQTHRHSINAYLRVSDAHRKF